MKSVFVYANVMFILISKNNTYSKSDKYMMISRQFGVYSDVILTKEEIDAEYPKGKWLKGVNFSDTITFDDM